MAQNTYPPAFDPDRILAEDLGLYNIDVFMEGEGNNPMFFNIRGIDKVFAYGKHYFTISFKDHKNLNYQLKYDSEIIFEVRDSMNTLLKSQFVKIDYENSVAVGYFEVEFDPGQTYYPISDGEGKLIIVAELTGVPTKWAGAYNYRCIFPIHIIKNYLNANSPAINSLEHSIRTFNGAFSFGTGEFHTISYKGGMRYNHKGQITHYASDGEMQ